MFAMRYKHLGAKIAYYRKINGMTQNDLANKIGISVPYLSKIERGSATQGVPLSIYWRIAKGLDVDFEKLLED